MIYTAILSLSYLPRNLKIKRDQLGIKLFILFLNALNIKGLKLLTFEKQQNLGHSLP